MRAPEKKSKAAGKPLALYGRARFGKNQIPHMVQFMKTPLHVDICFQESMLQRLD
jgi:hypothetical protein